LKIVKRCRLNTFNDSSNIDILYTQTFLAHKGFEHGFYTKTGAAIYVISHIPLYQISAYFYYFNFQQQQKFDKIQGVNFILSPFSSHEEQFIKISFKYSQPNKNYFDFSHFSAPSRPVTKQNEELPAELKTSNICDGLRKVGSKTLRMTPVIKNKTQVSKKRTQLSF